VNEAAEMEMFWREKHEGADRVYLTGNGENTLDKLHVRGLFFTVVALLNIGVGLGEFERFARAYVQRLDCADITRAALTAVTGVADHFYEGVSFVPKNTYDLVTELLVAQHVSDATLHEHLAYGIAALREDGIFALQVADYLQPPTPDVLAKNYTTAAMKAGSVKRTETTVRGLIERAGGAVINVIRGQEYPAYESVWVVYHIKRTT